MAEKKKRIVLGSLCKARDEDAQKGFPNYIQVKEDVTLKKGEYIRAESKAFQLRSVEKALAEGKLTEEIVGKVKERIEKIPDFVIAELILTR